MKNRLVWLKGFLVIMMVLMTNIKISHAEDSLNDEELLEDDGIIMSITSNLKPIHQLDNTKIPGIDTQDETLIIGYCEVDNDGDIITEIVSEDEDGNSVTSVEKMLGSDGNPVVPTTPESLKGCKLDSNNPIRVKETYEEMGSNDQLELFLNKETMAIAVRNKNNNYVWYSNDPYRDLSNSASDVYFNSLISGIKINLFQKIAQPQRLSIESENTVTKLSTNDGFEATLDFKDVKIRFKMIVKLVDNQVKINIPYDGIEEYDPLLYTPNNYDYILRDIVLYPFFGSITHSDTGYITIPDGVGALINLKDKDSNHIYDRPVYDIDTGYLDNTSWSKDEIYWDEFLVKDLSTITMPVYTIVHEEYKNAILGIAEEESAPYAHYTYSSRGSDSSYYQSYFKYQYRRLFKQNQSKVDEGKSINTYQKEPSKFDINQTYIILDGEDASYVGAAKEYRKKLENEGVLTGVANNFETTPLKVDILGNEITKGIFGLKNTPVTTYEEAISVLETLMNDGYTDLNVSFKTMYKEKMAFRFDALSNLGGSKGLNELIEFTKKNDLQFGIYSDYTYKLTNQSEVKGDQYLAKKLNRGFNMDITLAPFTYELKINPKYFVDFVKDDIETLKQFGIQNIALDNLTKSVFSFYDEELYSRVDAQKYIQKALEILVDNNINVGAYNSGLFGYRYMNEYYNVPLVSSNLNFTDRDIPFVQLVLSGHMDMYAEQINNISNEEDTLLRMVEYSAYPSVLLTYDTIYSIKGSSSDELYVSEYERLSNRLKSYYSIIDEGLKATMGSEMIDHKYLVQGVSMVTYGNGNQIIVNYNNTPFEYGGYTVEAKAYVVL